jgi:glutathione S-transferase
LSAISRFCLISTTIGRRAVAHASPADYLRDRFTAGDLLKTTVLRILRHADIVSGRPALQAYQERCEARPAFQKALADHLKPFETAAA